MRIHSTIDALRAVSSDLCSPLLHTIRQAPSQNVRIHLRLLRFGTLVTHVARHCDGCNLWRYLRHVSSTGTPFFNVRRYNVDPHSIRVALKCSFPAFHNICWLAVCLLWRICNWQHSVVGDHANLLICLRERWRGIDSLGVIRSSALGHRNTDYFRGHHLVVTASGLGTNSGWLCYRAA